MCQAAGHRYSEQEKGGVQVLQSGYEKQTVSWFGGREGGSDHKRKTRCCAQGQSTDSKHARPLGKTDQIAVFSRARGQPFLWKDARCK